MYALVEMLHQTMAAKSSTRMRFVMVGHVTGVDLFSLGPPVLLEKILTGAVVSQNTCAGRLSRRPRPTSPP